MDFSFTNRDEMPNWIRVGEVSEVDAANCTARVVFDDDDGFVSSPLPVIQRNTQGPKDYWLPTVGEDVLCVFLPFGEEDGFILGSYYADEVTPPQNSETVRYLEFPDGAKIVYDWNEQKLEVSGAKNIKVTVPNIEFIGNLKVEGNIETTGTVDADGEITSKKNSTPVHLTTHLHTNAIPGPSTPPTVGS